MSLEQQDGAFDDFASDPQSTPEEAVHGGFLSGLDFGTPVKGVASGVLDAVSVAARGLPDLAKKSVAGIPGMQESFETLTHISPQAQAVEQAGEYAQKVSTDAHHAAKELAPDPRTAGTAANVVFGASKVMTEAGLLSATGAEGGTVAGGLGYIEGISRYRDLRDQGVDEETASKAASVDGLMQTAGMFAPAGLPASWIESMEPVNRFLTQLATGAASNVGQGVANRYVSHKILEDAGFHDMAEASKPFDGEALAADLLSGAFFGGVHFAGQRGEFAQRAREAVEKGLLSPQVRDAAKVVQDFHEATIERAPGVPVDYPSQSVHMASLEKATADLLADQPADVSKQVKDGATFARPAEHTEPTRQVFLDAFKEAGVAEEWSKLEDLNELMEGRYTHPPVKPQERELRLPISETEPTGGGEPAYDVSEEPLTDEQLQAFKGLRSEVPADQELGATRERESGQPGTENAGQPGGEPLRVFRGGRGGPLTEEHFQPEVLGKATGHPSSGLGVFFSLSKDEAARYGTVTEHHLDIRNPKHVKAEDLPGFDTLQEAHDYREKLRAEGHDGMVIDASHLGGPVNFVAFSHDQVKRPAAESADLALERAGTQTPEEKEAPTLLKAVSNCVGKTA